MIHRVFAAIRPPDRVIEHLMSIQGAIDGARWQDASQLHCTLRFFGEIAAASAEDVAEALAGVRADAFMLELRGVGHFETRGKVHTLWAGVAPSAGLFALQRQVESAARRAGLPPEPRRFTPHITLARLNRASGPVGAFLQNHGGLRGEPWQVEAFDLMESTLTPGGAEYETVRRYRLGG